jgi:hypothetical protein
MRRLPLPVLILSAVLMAGGGALHLRDWLRTYRAVPWEIPGAWVVRLGFPLNAAASLLLAVALVVVAARRPRHRVVAIAAGGAFQAASLAALVLSRHGGVFGWTEPGWTMEARQILALEIATMVALAAVAGVLWHSAGRVPVKASSPGLDAPAPRIDAEPGTPASAAATRSR